MTSIRTARKLEKTFSFIDNLTVLNDGGKFERGSAEIYLPKRFFLDLVIEIRGNSIRFL